MAWLTGQAPLQAPQEKQAFKWAPPGCFMTSALKPGFVSIVFLDMHTPQGFIFSVNSREIGNFSKKRKKRKVGMQSDYSLCIDKRGYCILTLLSRFGPVLKNEPGRVTCHNGPEEGGIRSLTDFFINKSAEIDGKRHDDYCGKENGEGCAVVDQRRTKEY